jgi:hypothetical protein
MSLLITPILCVAVYIGYVGYWINNVKPNDYLGIERRSIERRYIERRSIDLNNY